MKRVITVLAAALALAAVPAAPASAEIDVESGAQQPRQLAETRFDAETFATDPALKRSVFYRDSQEGVDGRAESSYAWPAPASYPSFDHTGCAQTGCADVEGHDYAGVDLPEGVLRAAATASLRIGNEPNDGYGLAGYTFSDGAASVDDSITLSAPATVVLRGRLQGSVSSYNSDYVGQGNDPRAEITASVAISDVETTCDGEYCFNERYADFTHDAGVDADHCETGSATNPCTPSPTSVDVPFEITADLPAGTFNVDADLATSIHYQVYGDGQEVIVKDARLLFADSLTFEIEVPDGVVATSGSGLLPIVGGAQPEPPALAVADATVTEGSSGTTAVDLTVTRSEGSGTSTVQYATVDGSATAGADYTATSGSVTFAAGETEKSVRVLVTGDTVDEPDETFGLELTAPTGATVADGSATVTITDDDEPAPLTPAERLRALRAQLDSMDLPKGLATSLGAKLDAALAAMERGRVEASCGSLTAFGNQVAASSPARLAEEAARLATVEAAAIRDALGCG